ncbi:MAG: hypothetical protein JXA78_08265 [Anaerolineales bacterium]|nr:hypothetical protein [Anaerolineales bacterium]
MTSTELFWLRVAEYNQSTLPITILMTLAAAFLAYRVFFKPGPKTDAWMKAFLCFAFAWNGVIFFLVFVRNPISMFTGAPLFILIALLFAVDIFSKKTHFRLPEASWKKGLTILWIGLAFLYPLIGLPLGHVYPKSLLPTFPCPLTVFAIAFVAASAPNVDRKVFILLLPWALMALPKCFGALDCYEDCILFAAGVYGLVELVRNWKASPARVEQFLAQQEGIGQ